MSKRIFGLFILAGLFLAVAAKAESVVPVPAWEFTSPTNQLTHGNYTIGVVFTVDQDVSVGYLGYFDPTGGMTTSHLVGIYDVSTETLLASTTVTSSSPYASANFLYNAITPIELNTTDTYVIEGVSGSDLYTNQVSGFTLNPVITIDGYNFQSGSGGLNLDGTVQTGIDYFGPDFGDATPEPSTLLLLGSGLAGLAGLIKRKRMA
jgi:hypothetical protein